MPKRKLEDLNLLDDFLFGTMLTYPGIGQEFVRKMLETIFERKFGELQIIPQKVYYGTDTDKHGARLDVYLEESADTEDSSCNATVYDLEPDKNDNRADCLSLPKRTRFYHAKIDADSLQSGEKYSKLKNVIVIMITPYDPFGWDHMVYTIRSKCEELPEMPYDDGARTLYLYTKGTQGNPPEALRQLLKYMEHTTRDNISNSTLEMIHGMVEQVKQDREVSLEYMKIFEREEMLLSQGRREGREEGIREEQANTEKERKRADEANQRARAAEEELRRLQEELRRLKNQ